MTTKQIIIGITGTLGAGKGTIVDYLIAKKGFKHYSVRAFLIKEIEKRGIPNNRDSMVLVANELRATHSPSYIVEQLYEQAKADGGNAIIESLRAVGEVKKLQEKKGFYFFAIDAQPQTRYQRVTQRKTSTDNITYNEFVANEQRELTNDDPNKQNLAACMKLANYTFNNNGSIEELYNQIDETITTLETKLFASEKRTDYISWDDYFMGVSILSSLRSKDPSTQVGACIVNDDKKIIGIGYNGWPRGIHEDELPWGREGGFLETKYAYVVHAESNAIQNATTSLKGATLYVALTPCNECAKVIIQSGIKEVVYLSDKYKEVDVFIAGRKMLELAGVKMREFKPETSRIEIDFDAYS